MSITSVATGLHADVARRHGYRVLGVDYSSDQLRLAHRRLPVARADARSLPVKSGSVQLVFSMLTHTDLAGFDRLIAECVRVLAPGRPLVYIGVHPCFVNPFADFQDDGVRLHAGYRGSDWQPPTPFTGDTVRHRVGVYHLPLEQLLAALLHSQTKLERIIERGGGSVPEILAFRLLKVAAPAGEPVGRLS